MLLIVQPHAEGDLMDLGSAMNEVMKRARIDDWVCFLDTDAMFANREYYNVLTEAIDTYKDAGYFLGMTNRLVGAQVVPGVDNENHDICYHRDFGTMLADKYRDVAVEYTGENPATMLGLTISKRHWEAVGGFCRGWEGVDNDIFHKTREAGKKIYLLPALYIYHWYRADGDDDGYQQWLILKDEHYGPKT
jgi:GT2 family glycosyltransferase